MDRLFEYKYDERVRILRRTNFYLQICLVVWMGFGLFLVYVFVVPGYYPNTDVDYSELNQSERENAYSLIESLKPDYLHLAKNIKFVKNQSDMDTMDTAGENWMNGRIKVLYNEDTENHLHEILCHEILHTSVNGIPKSIEEEIVGDLGETEVCFKNE